MGKPKVLWLSDLVTPTGFSRVSHSIIENIEQSFDITGIGINYFGDPHNYKFRIFPANTGKGDFYGEKRLIDLLLTEKFDLLFILNDVWVIDRLLKAIKKFVPKDRIPKIIIYFPVDADFHDPEWYSNFDIVTVPVVYTQFAKSVVEKIYKDKEVKIINHGVDTNKFYKKYPHRIEAKLNLLGNTIPSVDFLKDSFIVLNGNRNQPRKRIDITLDGFAKFAKDKPANVKLYMHCGFVDASMNVVKLAERFNISERLILSTSKPGPQAVSDERLCEIYNACDVGINTSLGEGWGLVNVEHSVTGAPQIVPNHSACKELFDGVGFLVPAKYPIIFDHVMTRGWAITADDLASTLQTVYEDRKLADEVGEAARQKFSAPEYSWKFISKEWEDLFFGVLNDVTSVANEH